jgi:hypothetical protein
VDLPHFLYWLFLGAQQRFSFLKAYSFSSTPNYVILL